MQTWFSSQTLSSQFVSPATWMHLAGWFSLKNNMPHDGQADILFSLVLIMVLILSATTWLLGATWLAWRRGVSWSAAFCRWGFYGGLWFGLLGLWDWISLGMQMIGAESLVEFWGLTPAFWCAMCLAGWGTTWLTLGGANPQATWVVTAGPSTRRPRLSTFWLWSMVAVYVVVFVTLNWRLYFNLLIPHGDSVMYEEHLWNVLHGKGFRSYLDQGLFLGEHIQVVHLGLLPMYLLWPSHLLLELCESLALAVGAFPVFWMTRRHTGSERAGLAAAAAYLLYPPMQFLDIEIDLKTFRPEAFGIPLLLLTLDQLDRRNLWGVVLGILGCLTVKEDYAIVLAPLGVWMALFGSSSTNKPGIDCRWMIFGILVAVGSVAYLYLATRLMMPWFRSGVEIHYAKYFSKFGETPEQIVRTMLTNPGLLLGEFFRVSTALYALMLLVPLAFIPLLSPSRLAVGLPLFGILCLNELARDPRHQFHAPLVAIVFWALAGGWPRAVDWTSRVIRAVAKRSSPLPNPLPRGGGEGTMLGTTASSLIRHAVWTSSLAMGLFFSLHPLSLTFWDAKSEWHWRKLYGPSQRAVEFAKIADLIPPSARVASTDFVHPRYTHHARSYDYSGYRRKVSGYESKVPDDTDYIVIDTRHRYSDMKTPAEIPEYRDHSEEWELLPDVTEGYFIVLKRKASQP